MTCYSKLLLANQVSVLDHSPCLIDCYLLLDQTSYNIQEVASATLVRCA
jgi:hypothetical protein